VVFGGTLAPLIAETLGLPTLSVGTPYFNPSFSRHVLPLLALPAHRIQVGWKKGKLSTTNAGLLVTLAISVVLSAAVIVGIFGRSAAAHARGYALGSGSSSRRSQTPSIASGANFRSPAASSA